LHLIELQVSTMSSTMSSTKSSIYYLKRVTGKHQNKKVVKLSPGQNAIGRKEGDVICESHYCSREHGTLYVTEDSVKIEDHQVSII
jgi:hypothetical protein